MKNLLILPGGSPKNLVWGQECEDFFKDEFDTISFIQYDNWKSGEKNLDFEREIAKIKEVATSSGSELYVFAKSIGSILTLKAVEGGVLSPVKCVFFGMPFSLVSESIFSNNWTTLSNFTIPAIAFHNTFDPTADYGFTEEKIKEYSNSIRLITQNGDTHDYLNFVDFELEIKKFIS